MKGRLKEALDEKKDFEIEFLQLQKNFVRKNNELKKAREQIENLEQMAKNSEDNRDKDDASQKEMEKA